MSRKALFESTSPVRAIVELIGTAPGTLGNKPVQARQRSALKYYCRVALNMTRDEVQGELSVLRTAYDSNRSQLWYGQNSQMTIAQLRGKPDDDSDDDNQEEEEGSPMPNPTPMQNNPTPVPVAAKPVPTPASDAVSQLQGALAAMMASVSSGLDIEAVKAVVQSELKNHKNPVVTLRIETPTQVKELANVVLHNQFNNLVTMLGAGVWPMLVGPAGSGKTTGCELAAQALDKTFRFTGAVDSPHALRGYRIPTGEYISTAYRESFVDEKGFFLWDEIDASDPSAVKAFNADMANGIASFPDGIVTRAKGALFSAAANTWGLGQDRSYVGSGQLDASTLDRFASLPWDYDEDLERALCGNDDWCAFVQGIRKSVFSLKLRYIISPRASIMGAKLLAAKMPKSDVINACVRKGIDDATWSKIQAGV